MTLSQRIRPVPPVFRIAAIAAVILVLVAATVLIAGASRPRLPHFGSAANGPITYVDGDTIQLAAADGTRIRSGAAIPAGSESLTFSPDGTHLAYRLAGPPASIVIADADGGHAHPVSTIPAASSEQVGVNPPFAFSPDGSRMAFTALEGTYRRVRLADVNGANLATLDPVGLAATDETFDPAWSADGQLIAFMWHRGAIDLFQIYLVHPDGTGGHILPAAFLTGNNLELAWSPDPARQLLAYVDGGDAGGGNIAIRDVNSLKTVYAGTGLWITWSPDGKQLAWWDGQTRVAPVNDILGGLDRSITLFPNISGVNCAAHLELAGQAICGPAQWSPDSTLVYGTAVGGKVILVARADGTGSLVSIPLDHPVDITNGPNGSLSWRAVAP